MATELCNCSKNWDLYTELPSSPEKGISYPTERIEKLIEVGDWATDQLELPHQGVNTLSALLKINSGIDELLDIENTMQNFRSIREQMDEVSDATGT